MAWNKHAAAGHALMRNVLLMCLLLTGSVRIIAFSGQPAPAFAAPP